MRKNQHCWLPLTTGWGQIVTYQQRYTLPKDGGSQLCLFDQNLNKTDSLLYSERDTHRSREMISQHDNFSMYDGDIYFTYKMNDTVFKMDESKVIIPEVVVKMGNLNPPTIHYQRENENSYLPIVNFLITDNFYFFTLMGTMSNPFSEQDIAIEYLVHNKIHGESFFLEEHQDKYLGDQDNSSSMPYNDLDGLSSQEFFYFSRGGIHADALEISTAKPFIESDSFDPSKLATQKYYKKVKKLLDESDIEDNPIIRICYLK